MDHTNHLCGWSTVSVDMYVLYRNQVLGADQFVQLDRWREIDSLARIINFIVIARPNFSLEKKPKVSVEFMHIEMPLSGESSSSIREDRKNGKSIIGRVPQSVQAFISQESLYK